MCKSGKPINGGVDCARDMNVAVVIIALVVALMLLVLVGLLMVWYFRSAYTNGRNDIDGELNNPKAVVTFVRTQSKLQGTSSKTVSVK